jgi:hypothetical protein
MTSATTTSLGGGKSRYLNDEDVNTILVSNDPGVFALISVNKQVMGCVGHCLQGRGDYRIRTGW